MKYNAHLLREEPTSRQGPFVAAKIRKLSTVFLLFAIIMIGCFLAYKRHNIPTGKQDQLVADSASADQIFKISRLAGNGHFESTPKLQNLLGDQFDEFLIAKLSSQDIEIQKHAACILAYADDRPAEQAIAAAYLNATSEDEQLGFLFFLGWTATEKSRGLFVDILERRTEGARWSALRSLGMSSISNRYDLITAYLNDPDPRVREEAERALETRVTNLFESELAKVADPILFPLAISLAEQYDGKIPNGELPKELAGRTVQWGRIYLGVLDLRFENNKGILINPSQTNRSPMINGYMISGAGGGGGPEGIMHYTAF